MSDQTKKWLILFISIRDEEKIIAGVLKVEINRSGMIGETRKKVGMNIDPKMHCFRVIAIFMKF